jgi:hypothetical protein
LTAGSQGGVFNDIAFEFQKIQFDTFYNGGYIPNDIIATVFKDFL